MNQTIVSSAVFAQEHHPMKASTVAKISRAEVIPMARSLVARQLVKLGGDPEYREGFVTDNGNIILDVYNLNMNTPVALENSINILPGVVENGIFANRIADNIIVACSDGVKHLK